MATKQNKVKKLLSTKRPSKKQKISVHEVKCETDEDERKRRCFICLCLPVNPLFLCHQNHFACATCIKPIFVNPKVKISWVVSGDLFYPEVKIDFEKMYQSQCGQCKERMCPHYVGASVNALLNDENAPTNKKCEFCDMRFPVDQSMSFSAQRAEHILDCTQTDVLFPCPMGCKNMIAQCKLQKHIEIECTQHQCKKNNCYNDNKMRLKELTEHAKEHHQLETVVERIKDLLEMADLWSLDILQETYTNLKNVLDPE